jgi:predicted metal-binding protein
MVTVFDRVRDYLKESPLAFFKVVPLEELRFDERAKYMCKFGCKNYGRKYSCPPESLKLLQQLMKRRYRWAILFATTYKVPDPSRRYQVRALNLQKELEIQRISRELAAILSDHNVDHHMLSGGPCRRCKDCALKYKNACKKPTFKQVSMEAVGIDCQITMHCAGFDFEMPTNGSINRCGCILTDIGEFSEIHLNSIRSLQQYRPATYKLAREMCERLNREYSHLFESVELIPVSDVTKGVPTCNSCRNWGKNFACPPYSEQIDIGLWDFAAVWKWEQNNRKKDRYNIALKTIHAAFFSLGYYFALSIRDCYCDECDTCARLNVENQFCSYRKLLSPSLQSQHIDPRQFGEGRFGLELL